LSCPETTSHKKGFFGQRQRWWTVSGVGVGWVGMRIETGGEEMIVIG